ncbi:LacI family DNA-binding transcriptional regulator [Turicibacter bilis]|uniref:LacI family DNA-binding transcriptional regulator n=1 Tax=Turicibacter bilis TaxID=2735723 RepID=UPI0031B9B737
MNIIEIAKLAGVSKSTVSRYLNDGYVSEEASEKIKEVIEQTGFVPRRQAQAMRSQKTNLIGIIVPKISTETAARVIEGITNELSNAGYEVLIGNTSQSIEKEFDYLKVFKNQVDGIIFMATEITPKHYELFEQLHIPIVVVAQKVKDYPCIVHDDYHASKDAINYLIDKGHRSIGFIGVGEYDVAVGVERKKGYLDALEEQKIEAQSEYIQIGDFSHESGFNLTKYLMSLPKPPSAIFAVTDNLAIGCMEYLKENGYKIPDDVAVMGLGDIKIAAYMTPGLTTIHYHFQTMGAKSANLLMQLIQSGKESSKNYESNFIFNYRLIERDSV